mmetsp:Transcript_89216/g.158160  ORF Transcript_89216/g.158160 Transcript_89216/m.158160 type:complete len:276 (-) Transcript_89216:83-910(-)
MSAELAEVASELPTELPTELPAEPAMELLVEPATELPVPTDPVAELPAEPVAELAEVKEGVELQKVEALETQVASEVCAEEPGEEVAEDGKTPSSAELAGTVSTLLAEKDLETVSLNQLKSELEQHLGLSLDDRKDELRELVTAELKRIMHPETPEKKTQKKPKTQRGQKRKQRATDLLGLLSEAQQKARRIVQKCEDAEDAGAGQETSKAEFLKGSPLSLQLGEETLELSAKSFSSGSCGYYTCAKVKVTIDGVQREMQCQLSCAVLGSENWSD